MTFRGVVSKCVIRGAVADVPAKRCKHAFIINTKRILHHPGVQLANRFCRRQARAAKREIRILVGELIGEQRAACAIDIEDQFHP